MPWVVVKFHSHRDGDGLTLTTIPSSWVKKVGGKNYALYPPVDISGSVLKRLVYKGEDPNNDWDLLYLKYVSPSFDSVMLALDFECKAADLSEIDLEVYLKTGTIGKRKRKAKDIRYPSEPISSEDDDVVEITDPLSTTGFSREGKTQSSKRHASPMKVANNQVVGALPAPAMKLMLRQGKTVKIMQYPRKTLPNGTENQASSSIWTSNMLSPKQSGNVNAKDLIKVIPVHKLDEPQANSSGLRGKTPPPKLRNDGNMGDLIKVIPVHKLDEPNENLGGLHSIVPKTELCNDINVNVVPVQKVNELQSISTGLQSINMPIAKKCDDVSAKVGPVHHVLDSQASSSGLQNNLPISKKCDGINLNEKIKVISVQKVNDAADKCDDAISKNGQLISLRQVNDILGSSVSLQSNMPIAEKHDTNNLKCKIISVRKVNDIQGNSRSFPNYVQYPGKFDESILKGKIISIRRVGDIPGSLLSSIPIAGKCDDNNMKGQVISIRKVNEIEGASRSLLCNIPTAGKCDENQMKGNTISIKKVDDIQGDSRSLLRKMPIPEKCDENNMKDKVIPVHKVTALQAGSSSLQSVVPITKICNGVSEKVKMNMISLQKLNEIQGSSSSLQSNMSIAKKSDVVSVNLITVQRVNEPHTSSTQSSTIIPEKYNDVSMKEAIPAYNMNEFQASSSSLESNLPISEICDDIDMMDSFDIDQNVDELQESSSVVQSTELIPKVSSDADVKDLIKSFERKVTQQMSSILKKISFLEQGMITLSAKIDSNQTASNPPENFSDCEDLHLLPVDSLEDLFSLQKEIATSPKYRRYMMKTLKDYSAALFFRGLRMKDIFISLNRTVYSCLATIMTNSVAMMLCMKGKSLHKVSFELNFSKLISLIYDVVREKKLNGPEIDLFLLKRSIGEWFRMARLRSGNGRPVKTLFEIRENDVKMEDDYVLHDDM